MKMKDMAVGMAVSGILIQAWATPISAAHAAAPEPPLQFLVELAGADEPDRATSGQLKKAGQPMVPAEGMKKAEPKAEPSAMPAAPMKSAEDGDKMPAKAAPAAEAKPEGMAKPAAEKKQMQPAGAGFYLRADVGYGLATDPDGTTSAGAMTAESVDNAALIGAGLGYRFNQNFRADVTADFRADADISATTAGGTAVTSEVNGWTVMANAYFDITDYQGITPYVGAGIGYARLDTSTQTGDTADAGTGSDNLAWAGMLGLAIDLGVPGAAIDLGYRLISLGEFQQASGGASYNDLVVHEVRAGFRYMF